MVEVMREIRERRSGRVFSSRPVDKTLLESILEAGRWAPSCSNTQAWDFVVLTDADALKKAHAALSRGNSYAKSAPIMIIVVSREDHGCDIHGLPYFMMDVGLSVENMLLQAVHLGLMGHATAGWDEEMLKSITGIPAEYRVITVVFFGYPGDLNGVDESTRAKELQRSTRRPLSEIVHWNKW